VIKLLQAAVNVKTQAAAILEPVLEIADSVMTYRRRHFEAPQLPGVLALVLLDDSNPRSLAFQINVLSELTAALLADSRAADPEAEQARISSLAGRLRSVDLNAVAAQHAQGIARPLLTCSTPWQQTLRLVQRVTSHYFNHITPRFS